MNDLLDTIQQRHQEKLEQFQRGEVDEDFLEDIRTLMNDLRQAGAVVADPDERGQLRALMHFWANAIYDHTGTYPDTSLQPLARGEVASQPEREEEQVLIPPLGWALMGAAVLVIAAGAFLFTRLGFPPELPIPTVTTPTVPPTPVAQIDVGLDQNDTGELSLSAGTFCTGTSEIAAQFTIPDPLPADAKWGWKLTRGGSVVAEQSSLAWETRSTDRMVGISASDGKPFDEGEYELTFLVNEQPAANRLFEVIEPQISNLDVSNVPTRTGRTTFEAGTDIVYVIYDYDGLCAGASISCTVYRDGRVVKSQPSSGNLWPGMNEEKSGTWRWEYYRSNGLPLERGNYKVKMGFGKDLLSTTFTITGTTSPAFGDITLAQGVEPDGTPILTQPDNRFDWNTKVIHAIFDYAGMQDGLKWTAVWTRNDQEISRQEGLWDVDTFGTKGTRWVTYHAESRSTLNGGNYSVTLLIEGEEEKKADFYIRYYVP